MKYIPRFFIKKDDIDKDIIKITNPNDIHKILHVLRLKTESSIIVTLDNTEYHCLIAFTSKQEIDLTVVKKINIIQTKPIFDITVAQALPKSDKINSIISMNTEIGAKNFIFFQGDYSQISTNKFNLERALKIAKEACLQSERVDVPEISVKSNLKEILETKYYDVKIMLHSRQIDNSKLIDDLIKGIRKGTSILVIVGPEGGFSDQEVSLGNINNINIVYLPTNILRVETASIAICSKLLL